MNNFEVNTFLADSVDIAQGKIYALGAGWDTIFTQNLPAQHPRIGLGILINVPYTETNKEHTLSVSLQDEDGNLVNNLNLQAPFKIGRPAHLKEGDSQLIPFAFNFDGLVFEKAAAYRWIIQIDQKIFNGNTMRVTN